MPDETIKITKQTAEFIIKRLESERKNLKAALKHPQVTLTVEREIWLRDLDKAISEIGSQI